MSNACPACRAPLIAFEFEGVELDHCVECKGTWLDQGELKQIALLAGVPDDGLLSKGLRVATADQKSASRACPRCGGALEVIVSGSAEAPVTLDRCPRGDGLLLDRGELAALLRQPGRDAADRASRDFLGGLFRHELDSPMKGA